MFSVWQRLKNFQKWIPKSLSDAKLTIHEKTGLFKAGDSVLDIGSSAGGFLLFAREIASHVHGIEFILEFHSYLSRIAHEHPGITVESGDIFAMTFDK